MQLLSTRHIHFITNDILHIVFQIRLIKKKSRENSLYDTKDYHWKVYTSENNFEKIKLKKKNQRKFIFYI